MAADSASSREVDAGHGAQHFFGRDPFWSCDDAKVTLPVDQHDGAHVLHTDSA